MSGEIKTQWVESWKEVLNVQNVENAAVEAPHSVWGVGIDYQMDMFPWLL
jgi:hypothetical protein